MNPTITTLTIKEFSFPVYLIFVECSLKSSTIRPFPHSLSFSLIILERSFINSLFGSLYPLHFLTLGESSFEFYFTLVQFTFPIEFIVLQFTHILERFPNDFTISMHFKCSVYLSKVLSLIGENFPIFSRNQVILIKAPNEEGLLVFIVQISMTVHVIGAPFSLVIELIANWFPLLTRLPMIGGDQALEQVLPILHVFAYGWIYKAWHFWPCFFGFELRSRRSLRHCWNLLLLGGIGLWIIPTDLADLISHAYYYSFQQYFQTQFSIIVYTQSSSDSIVKLHIIFASLADNWELNKYRFNILDIVYLINEGHNKAGPRFQKSTFLPAGVLGQV